MSTKEATTAAEYDAQVSEIEAVFTAEVAAANAAWEEGMELAAAERDSFGDATEVSTALAESVTRYIDARLDANWARRAVAIRALGPRSFSPIRSTDWQLPAGR